MISTSLMIRLGRVKGNKMVDMKLSNAKLVNRAITMIINELNISESVAKELLDKYGSVRGAIENYV
jgi:N-acetylmuramic acid 6-phosphate etherase